MHFNCTATVPSKVILTGEHAVVYKKTAIAAAVQIFNRVTLTIHPGPAKVHLLFDGKETEYSWEVLPDHSSTVSVAGLVAFFLLKYFPDKPDFSFRIIVRADAPLGSGLGSSASLCVALAGLLHVFARQLSRTGSVDLEAINQAALEGETLVHGKASGIDNTVVTYGGVLSYDGVLMQPVPAQPFRLLIVNSNVPKLTSTTVARVRSLLEEDPELAQHLLDSVGLVSLRFKEKINSDLKAAQRLMGINHGLLHSLGVSSPELDQIVA